MTGNNDDLNSLVGRSLGQFRIVERIGAGGMATVFKAYQSTLDRYVAIKVLPAYHARDPVFVKRFGQEARSVAKLAHPNIVQIHDFGSEGDITYIVMEYVDGGTLKDRLKQALPVAEATDYVIQAAEGLECAHRNGIVHRDVKPANMLLRKDGHLLLSDFGIAKILEGTTNLTRVGVGIGTPQYMSPEQSMGQAVDRRSDIYSLGIVFFHCLTGHVPFQADSPITVTVKQVSEPLPVDHLIAGGVPAPIVQVVQKMTAKAPAERYQSADATIDALGSALANSNLMAPRSWRGAALPPAAQQPVDQAKPVGQLTPTSYS
ncbi:MAG TPA: serine/threonine-protein kinase, partial [Ktedonobacteraceae bacterium]